MSDGAVVAGDVEVEDGIVRAVGVAPPGRGGLVAVPGLVDLQVNGVGEVDFVTAGPEEWARAGRDLALGGTTSFQPTFVTGHPDRVLAALRRLPARAGPARCLGAHLEGPFLAPTRLGAHPAHHRREPDPELLQRYLAAGPVRHMTLAPELDGALGLVALARGRGVTVACGHSEATAAQAHVAFDWGATVVTHLFNAMALGDHRAPGLGLAALARSDVRLTVIADGTHVADEALLVAWRAGAGRLALVSDAVGRRPGDPATVPDGPVVRRPDGTLAGSTLPLLAGVRRLVSLGVPLPAAIEAATAVPASIAGAGGGTLRPGRVADVVVLDDALQVQRVLVGGLPVGRP